MSRARVEDDAGATGGPSPGAAARMRDARAGLLRELGAISAAVDAAQGSRCPYRDARDRCTFGGGCRNQRRVEASDALSASTGAGPAAGAAASSRVVWYCSGAALTP